jgi:hypothetical protein
MASDVDIANTALSHIGEDASIASMSTPDGSVQAGLCARFWPIARAELQEAFNWSFGARRATDLAEVSPPSPAWVYAYALPNECLKVRKVLPEGATDESKGEPFEVMERTLYTNVSNPTLIYSKLVLDAGVFTPMFVSTAGYLLASYLAGPILKKPAAGQAFYDMAMARGRAAAAINANASTHETHDSPAEWMTQR